MAQDACHRIGTVSFVVPDVDGDLVLDLELAGPDDLVVTNRYAAPVVRDGGDDQRSGRNR